VYNIAIIKSMPTGDINTIIIIVITELIFIKFLEAFPKFFLELMFSHTELVI